MCHEDVWGNGGIIQYILNVGHCMSRDDSVTWLALDEFTGLGSGKMQVFFSHDAWASRSQLDVHVTVHHDKFV